LWVEPYLGAGAVEETEMFRTFNMGVGMVVVVEADKVEQALSALPHAFVMGKVSYGSGVSYINAP
jgi:phosphoribosylformylglycinamidine cyclo-ligase